MILKGVDEIYKNHVGVAIIRASGEKWQAPTSTVATSRSHAGTAHLTSSRHAFSHARFPSGRVFVQCINAVHIITHIVWTSTWIVVRVWMVRLVLSSVRVNMGLKRPLFKPQTTTHMSLVTHRSRCQVNHTCMRV